MAWSMQLVVFMKTLLSIILALALGGVAFSGYLTYHELFGPAGGPTCTPVGEPGTALSAPPCVYGLAMYLIISVLALVALTRRPAKA